MSRVIKFRGLSVVNDKRNGIKVGDFVYGSYIQSGVDAPGIVFGDGEQIEVNPETVGMFTETLDSGSGDEAYEGDTIRFEEMTHNQNGSESEILEGTIEFSDGCLIVLDTNDVLGMGSPIELFDLGDFVIVGNIHQKGAK